MSTERHLSRKRPSVTIDVEAEHDITGSAADHKTGPAAPVEVDGFEPVADVPNTGEPAKAEPAEVESAKAEPSKAVPTTHSASSFSGVLTGGIVGAALALAGAYGLLASGFLPSQNSDNSTILDRISALETAAASGTSSEGEQVAGLTLEVDALKSSIAALSQAAGDSSVADRVTALEQSASLVTPATNGADMTALASRIATLESKTSDAALSETLTTARNALSVEINTLKSELAALKLEVSERVSDPGLAEAVAVSALRAAVDRGGAFAAELENLASVSPQSPAIAALRSFAAAGVPTRQDLIKEFEAAAQAMMAASEPVDPNATLFGRLMDSAKGLVKVRPVGAIDGDTPAARVARMGASLAEAEDMKVQSEFAALPASSRNAGAAFMARFNARAEADKLIAEAVRATSPKTGG